MIYNYSAMGKKSCLIRWKKVHSKVRLNNKLSREKAAIMAYLSGDGYIKFREKEFHYEISIAMDDLFVARRILKLFEKEYCIKPNLIKVEPTIVNGSGYYNIRISNKPVCLDLLSIAKYDSLNWSMPEKMNQELKIEWIKCFFDCEAHINQSRSQIQVKSVNGNGLKQINAFLFKLGINGKVYGPYNNGKGHNPYHMLSIYKLEDVLKYRKFIGFYHSKKKKALRRF